MCHQAVIQSQMHYSSSIVVNLDNMLPVSLQ